MFAFEENGGLNVSRAYSRGTSNSFKLRYGAAKEHSIKSTYLLVGIRQFFLDH